IQAGHAEQRLFTRAAERTAAQERARVLLARRDRERPEGALDLDLEDLAEAEAARGRARAREDRLHRARGALGGRALRSLHERGRAAHVERGLDVGLAREFAQQRLHAARGRPRALDLVLSREVTGALDLVQRALDRRCVLRARGKSAITSLELE